MNKDFDRSQGLDGSDIEALYNKSKPVSIVAGPETQKLVDDLKTLSIQKKNIEESYEQNQLKLMNIMKDNEIIEDARGNTLVTWKQTTRKNPDGTITNKRTFRLC